MSDEWSGTRDGQGCGPHGSGQGASYPSCPYCGGLKPGHGLHEFTRDTQGHQEGCEYVKIKNIEFASVRLQYGATITGRRTAKEPTMEDKVKGCM